MSPTSSIFNVASPDRRDLLVSAGAVAAGLLFNPVARGAEHDLSGIKALTFDVYGTCTDYWGTFVREGNDLNRRTGFNLDWDKFIEDWRGLYVPMFTAIIDSKRTWQSVTSIHGDALRALVRNRAIDHFSDADLTEINGIWERLDPWPDSIPGLVRLKRRYILSSLSNADMAGMTKLAKNSSLPWDVILAAELAQTFKPDPKVYQLAPRYLGLKPEEILMVACHKFDLRGARAQGFRTAFVARPRELGINGKPDTKFEQEFDLNVGSFLELADRLQV